VRLYRVSAPASPRRHLAKTLAWMALVWFLALVALPAVLRGVELLVGIDRWRLPGGLAAGAVVFVLASALGLRCAFAMARGEGTPVPFDAAARLVVEGPYRWVRNPMAVSGVSQTVGVALALGSPLYYLVPPAGALLWHLAIRPSEERFLASRFGRRYEEYHRDVPLWLPRRRSAQRRDRRSRRWT
jgi:protein-S-isoprenylcysteine O-methyltransferase Ste14